MMKKYQTNDLFNKALYVACLAKMDVPAYVVDDGVMIDMEAYKANYSASRAPMMIINNHRWVKALL